LLNSLMSEPQLPRGEITRNYLAVFAVAVFVYAVSCAPGSLWQDSGMLQYRTWHNDIEGKLGLALSHPLFYILAIGARYIPAGQFAHRVNLVSAIAGALAVANLFLLVRLWLGRNLPAVIAAVTFGVSHTFWRHSAIAETYTLYIALLLAELIMLLRYCQTGKVNYLYWLGLLNGLAIATHMLASIPLLCYAVLFVILIAGRKIGFKDLLITVVFWTAGAFPYMFLIIKNIIQTADVTGTLASAAFGNSWKADVLNTSLSLKIVKENFLFLVLNFPTPNILLFFAGCLTLSKISRIRAFNNILLAVLFLFLAFAFRYTIQDRYAFFIPFYCVVSIAAGAGACFLQTKISRKDLMYLILAFAFFPPVVYAIAPKLAERTQIIFKGRRQIPYRNDYEYFLQPWKTGYRGANRFAKEALGMVEDNAVIYADGTVAYPLLLTQQITNFRNDVTVVSSHGSINNIEKYDENVIETLFAEKAIYVVSPVAGYCPAFILENYDFVRTGSLYRVVKKG